MVSEAQFEELLAIVDHHAGRRHSTTGTVATALRAVLIRHDQMVRESMNFICDACKGGDHDACEPCRTMGLDGCPAYRYDGLGGCTPPGNCTGRCTSQGGSRTWCDCQHKARE